MLIHPEQSLSRRDDNDHDNNEQKPELTKKPKRHVHFSKSENPSELVQAQTIGFVPLLDEITEEESKDIWWGEEDLNDFKNSLQDIAVQLRENSKVRKCLGNAMKATKNTKHYSFWNQKFQKTYGLSDEIVWSKIGSIELNENTGSPAFLGLVDWCRHHGDRRGLEKWSCYDHYAVREKLYQDSLEAVLKEQMRQRLNDKRDNSMQAKEQAEMAIRSAVEASSIPARKLAWAFGAADAAAVHCEYEDVSKRYTGISIPCFPIFSRASKRK